MLSLGLLPFFMYLTYRVGKVNREVRGKTQESLAEMSAVTEETLSVSGMLLTKTFGQQAAAIGRFGTLNKELARLQVRQAMVGRWFFMIIGTIFSITPAFVYWLAGYLTIQGDPSAPTIGDIVAFTTLQSRLFFPLGQLLNVQVEIHGALALFDRIFEYLDMDPDIYDAPDAVALDPSTVAGGVRSATSRSTTRRRPCRRSRAGRRDGPRGHTDELVVAATDDGVDEPIVPTIKLAQPFNLDGIDFEIEPGSSSRSSGRRARARRRRPTSCRGCTTSTRARSRSMATTSGR